MSTTSMNVRVARTRPLRPVARGAAVVLLALTCSLPALAESQPKVHGLELVPWSKKIESGRYQSSRDWEGTLKYFRDKLRGWKGIRWHREVNLPTVKYIHIQNLNPKARWSGVNLYQLPSGEVRMYVLRRVRPDEKPDDKADKKASGKTARAPSDDHP